VGSFTSSLSQYQRRRRESPGLKSFVVSCLCHSFLTTDRASRDVARERTGKGTSPDGSVSNIADGGRT